MRVTFSLTNLSPVSINYIMDHIVYYINRDYATGTASRGQAWKNDAIEGAGRVLAFEPGFYDALEDGYDQAMTKYGLDKVSK